jgi:hypothetical protein
MIYPFHFTKPSFAISVIINHLIKKYVEDRNLEILFKHTTMQFQVPNLLWVTFRDSFPTSMDNIQNIYLNAQNSCLSWSGVESFIMYVCHTGTRTIRQYNNSFSTGAYNRNVNMQRGCSLWSTIKNRKV